MNKKAASAAVISILVILILIIGAALIYIGITSFSDITKIDKDSKTSTGKITSFSDVTKTDKDSKAQIDKNSQKQTDNYKSGVQYLSTTKNSNWKSDIDDGLIVYLPLDENTNDYADSNNVWCVAPGCPTPVNGKIANAYEFDGENDYLLIRSINSQLPDNKVSISYWLNWQEDSKIKYESVFGLFGEQKMLTFITQDGGYYFKFISISEQSNKEGERYEQKIINLQPGRWYHTVITYDGIKIRVYIDSELKATRDAQGLIIKDDNSLFIGSIGIEDFPLNNYLKGKIDDFRVYNRVLTQSEVNELYMFN